MIPPLEKIYAMNKDLSLSDDPIRNYRLIVEILGIIITDSLIFGMVTYDQIRGWVVFFMN